MQVEAQRQTHRQTDGQTDRQTDKQTDRQADTQADKIVETIHNTLNKMKEIGDAKEYICNKKRLTKGVCSTPHVGIEHNPDSAFLSKMHYADFKFDKKRLNRLHKLQPTLQKSKTKTKDRNTQFTANKHTAQISAFNYYLRNVHFNYGGFKTGFKPLLNPILVYWYIGILVYWYIGILVYWYIGILVYWYIGITWSRALPARVR